MKRVLFILALLGACGVPSQAFAEKRASADLQHSMRVSAFGLQNRNSDLGFRSVPTGAKVLLLNREFEFDSGFGGSLAYGFSTGKHLKPELEFSGRTFDVSQLRTATGDLTATGDVQTYSLLFNIPYTFPNKTRWVPYIGGGVGMAWQSGSFAALPDGSAGNVPISGDETTLAYQVLAGISYRMTPSWDVILGYKFFGTVNPEFGTLSIENRSHNYEVGVRFYLGKKKLKKHARKGKRMKRERPGQKRMRGKRGARTRR